MKKIRFFIPSLGGGGAEKVLTDLLWQLPKDLYDITLLTVSGGTHEKDLPPWIRFQKCVRCRGIVGRAAARFLLKLPYRVFSRLFMRGKYDVEIAYLEGFATRCVAALKTDAKKVGFVHIDLSVRNVIERFYPSTEACLAEYRALDKVCFVSESGIRGFTAAIGEIDNGIVLHNVIDCESVKRLSDEKPAKTFSDKGWKFVSVGRLVGQKAFSRLIRVMQKACADVPFELWIIGEGEQRQALEAQIAETGLPIRLLGYQENPYALVRQADAFLCSSVNEGYSTAVTEAILLGVPVITTDCAGMREIFGSEPCGIITENSEEGLLAGLTAFLSAPEKVSAYKAAAERRGAQIANGENLKEYLDLFDGV